MSWFDATGFASLAKTALKEVQRTVDKALDIKDEENKSGATKNSAEKGDDFFTTWGLPKGQKGSANQPKGDANTWGSFSGSFFENPLSTKHPNTKGGEEDGLCDESMETGSFDKSQLVVAETDPSCSVEILGSPSVEMVVPPRTFGTDTLRPVRDAGSASRRSSPESIEVIPESSLTSPSSVEVLDTPGGDENYISMLPQVVATLTEELHQTQQKHAMLEESAVVRLPTTSTSDASAHSAFLLPEDEAGFADSQHSSASASSCQTLTQNTVEDGLLKSLNSTISGSSFIAKENVSEMSLNIPINQSSQSFNSVSSKQSTEGSGGDVKGLLADAMAESMHLDNSQASSEGRDAVRVESEITSGHTSGDEMETTTSSDIEIISSPNGNSSSTQSPAKFANPLRRSRGQIGPRSDRSDSGSEQSFGRKGGPAFASRTEIPKAMDFQASFSRELSGCTVENMAKRLEETLQAREAQLVEMSRRSLEYEETNAALQGRVEDLERSHRQDLQRMDELTTHLSTLESKFQQVVREKQTLEHKLKQVSEDATTRLTLAELETDREQLREEGEKLSRQLGQKCATLKKLRDKTKENEDLIRNQKEQIEEQNEEIERLKRQLTAKEEVERNQIDAIRQLKCTVSEAEAMHSKFEDLQTELQTLKDVLQHSHRELAELKRDSASKENEAAEKALSAEMSARQELQRVVESMREEGDRQADNMQAALKEADLRFSRREQQLLEELSGTRQQLHRAEARNEELQQSLSAATKPLLRQLETIQSSFSSQQAAWEATEASLMQRLGDSKAQISFLEERERASHEQILDIQTQLQKSQATIQKLHENRDIDSSQAERMRQSYIDEAHMLRREIDRLKELLEREKSRTSTERDRAQQLQMQVHDHERRLSQVQSSFDSHQSSDRSSPIAGSATIEDACASADEREPVIFNYLHGAASASYMEGLQSQLQLREGEVAHLQNELLQQERLREALNEETTELSLKLDEAQVDARRCQEVERMYNALLQMYGEKVEENDELKLDLQDVKEMYKLQIEQLLKSHEQPDPS